MAAVSRDLMSSTPYGPGNMFTPQSNRNISKSSEFLKSFGNVATNAHTVEPHQTQKNRDVGLGGLPSSNDASQFHFEPTSDASSPYDNPFSTSGASSMFWNNGSNFRPLSPPDSASFEPKDWPFGVQRQYPSNIITKFHPSASRAQYGQVTPPDDEMDTESHFDYHLKDHLEQAQVKPTPADSTDNKRKRNSSAGNGLSSPPKRTRKYASRGSASNDPIDPNKPEDFKRSKFLERNRVAASKCRQKKKEWTQNLEQKARDLQKTNSMLRLDVESLRQEIMFLKGELWKHNTCNCTQIQSFLKSGSGDFADFDEDGPLFKHEHSPVASMSDIHTSSPQSTGSSNDVRAISPADDRRASSGIDENALEALLSSSLDHDTSDEGIAAKVVR